MTRVTTQIYSDLDNRVLITVGTASNVVRGTEKRNHRCIHSHCNTHRSRIITDVDIARGD